MRTSIGVARGLTIVAEVAELFLIEWPTSSFDKPLEMLHFAQTRSIKRGIAMILHGAVKDPLSFTMRAALVAIGVFLLAATVELVPANAEDVPEQAKQKDADPLQGTWTIMHLERGGHEFPKEILELGTLKMVIKGDTLRMTDGKKGEGATFKRDTAKKPHTIDLVFMEGEKEDIKRTALGIYQIDGDNLRFAWRKDGGKRPTKFASIRNERTSELVIVKRDKPK